MGAGHREIKEHQMEHPMKQLYVPFNQATKVRIVT